MTIPAALKPAFLQAVEAFNRQAFFECHEIIEDHLWRPMAPGADKTFLQGWLQVAVGFLHWRRGNYTGAKNLLSAGLEKLRTAETESPLAQAIDISGFITESGALHATLNALQTLPPYPANSIPVIHPV